MRHTIKSTMIVFHSPFTGHLIHFLEREVIDGKKQH